MGRHLVAGQLSSLRSLGADEIESGHLPGTTCLAGLPVVLKQGYARRAYEWTVRGRGFDSRQVHPWVGSLWKKCSGTALNNHPQTRAEGLMVSRRVRDAE